MIHPSSIIHPQAEIHSSVEIGPWCTIGPNVQIGRGTKLVSHVVVDGWTKIGEENQIFPFAVIGAIPQDLKYKGEKTELLIGDKNTIRESVTVNRGTLQGGGVTKLGDHNLLMANSHIGHDTTVGNHCILANCGSIAGHVLLEDYVTIGGLTGVAQFIRVGAHAYVGGTSGVERDVPPFCTAFGNRPCSLKGANIVGLRRRGYSADSIQKINEAIKLWVRSDVEKEQCLIEIESQYGDYAEIQRFVSFIRESEAGVAR